MSEKALEMQWHGG
ncbi:unnamed protein product, partial [Cuscuta epithymum]